MKHRSLAVTLSLQVAVLALAVYLWWVATDVLPAPQSIAHGFSPEEAFPALADLLGDGRLVDDAATSLLRLVLGLAIAALSLIHISEPTRRYRISVGGLGV